MYMAWVQDRTLDEYVGVESVMRSVENFQVEETLEDISGASRSIMVANGSEDGTENNTADRTENSQVHWQNQTPWFDNGNCII